MVLKLWETQVEVQGARPFQTSLSLGPGECGKLSSGRWTSGAFVHGGVAGVTKTSIAYPETTKFMCKALKRRTGQPFASVTVLVNCHSEQHVDSHNEVTSHNVVWNVAEPPDAPGVRFDKGISPLPSNAWVTFPPRVPHSSMLSNGLRILVIGYTPRSMDKLGPQQITTLKGLGFSLPDFPLVSVQAAAVECRGSLESPSLGTSEEEIEWETSVSVSADPEDLIPFLRGMFRRVHDLKTHFGRSVVHLSHEGVVDDAYGPLLATLQTWGEDAELQLQGEANWRAKHGDLEFQVRAVFQVHAEGEASPPSGLLHTRLVSNEEVRENLYAWKSAMEKEYQSLIEKGAIEPVSEDQVQAWISSGEQVEVLPGRGVASEKPQPGAAHRKKYRAVICGNFQAPHPDRSKETLYAGGADSVSIRTCLRWAGLRNAGASIVDVKTAFLNAPVDASESKYLICNPPRHMIMAGVVPQRTRWRVHGALYGLLTSPRAWSKERDGRMRKFRWQCSGTERRLLQCITDPNVWRLVDCNDQVLGLVTCYVDDLLVLGSRSEREAFLSHLRATWETSDPSHAEEGLTTYCGLELVQTAEGLVASQSRYVNELLLRHSEVLASSASPCSSWRDAFDDSESKEDPLEPAVVRQAQSLCGELLWLSVRARPEISFSIARMAQLTTRRPHDLMMPF